MVYLKYETDRSQRKGTDMAAKNKETDPALWRRHRRFYRILTVLLGGWVRRKFNYTCEDFDPNSIEGPMIIIPNHSCAWDPLLMGVAMRRRQMYFVASEHLLRMRFIGPLVRFLAAPIPRRKARPGTQAVMSCLRHLKAGHSICLFAEGEQTWDGLSGTVFPGSGKLARQSGATLVTYRLEGAYLSLPRWGKGVRRGKVYGHPVGIYPPEVLKGMKPDEIQEAINRDLGFDTWAWQSKQPGGPVRYRLKGNRWGAAQFLDKALFCCPACGQIGTLTAGGDEIRCSCGFRTRYTETGFFEPGEPFRTVAEWDAYGRQEIGRLLDRTMPEPERRELFADPAAELSLVEDGHTDRVIATGRLALTAGDGTAVLHIGDRAFDLRKVSLMAPILSDRLMFSEGKEYYQLKTKDINLRKYDLAWEHLQG
ncbi:MAG: 1-acyl-sn-glycerol-3-phosphate acyltransferase [Mogibacterium sp.]|nr:1-acyl-sn-glycerol-3-phosphate acyltransferase [Mogibacterium sp.]